MNLVTRTLSLLLPLLLLPACSNQELYRTLQSYEKNECMMVPRTQYRECMERQNQPFDEYSRQRGEVIGKNRG